MYINYNDKVSCRTLLVMKCLWARSALWVWFSLAVQIPGLHFNKAKLCLKQSTNCPSRSYFNLSSLVGGILSYGVFLSYIEVHLELGVPCCSGKGTGQRYLRNQVRTSATLSCSFQTNILGKSINSLILLPNSYGWNNAITVVIQESLWYWRFICL